jgi:RNA polymerase sigma factor (TIGR02999 family)
MNFDRPESNLSEALSNHQFDQVFSRLYPEIKKIAHAQLHQLQAGQTLTPTVLVSECYLKLQHKNNLGLKSDKHFYCLVAKCMKQFLIDQIRARQADKRNIALQTALVTQIMGEHNVDIRLMEVSQALDKLALIDADLSTLVELHTFAGLTFAEMALLLGVSKRQLLRRWQVAKSMLVSLLEGEQ